MILSTAAVADYEEQVSSFFRRANSKAEGEAALNQHSTSLLGALPDLLPTIKECPAYAGMAFYGRLQAVDLKLIRRLSAEGASAGVALESLRAGKALRVSAAAKAGWDLLKSADPDALWSAILLNLHRPASAAQAPVEVAEADDDEIDEDNNWNDDSTEGDDDDDQ